MLLSFSFSFFRLVILKPFQNGEELCSHDIKGGLKVKGEITYRKVGVSVQMMRSREHHLWARACVYDMCDCARARVSVYLLRHCLQREFFFCGVVEGGWIQKKKNL